MLPEPLNARYVALNRLSETPRATLVLVEGRRDGRRRIVKLTPLDRRPDPRAWEQLRRRRPMDGLVFPLEQDTTHDGRFYCVLPYYPDADLASRLRQRALGAEDCLEFVRQIQPVLEWLDADSEQGVLVHGDIKPSNFLVEESSDGVLRFLLSDFDTLRVHSANARVHRYTPRYAAPETLAGSSSASADYWSLGMVVLEWLSGSHPFANLDNEAVRRLVATDWTPVLDGIEDSAWRALLGGLLERNPSTRWRHLELGRWLARDASVMAEGLARVGEIWADRPYWVGGMPCHTLRALAREMLRQWSITALDDPALVAWVEGPVGRPDVRGLLERRDADADASDDPRLLRFCHAVLGRHMPPVWRGLELARRSLDETASRAIQGDPPARAWLDSLRDRQCLDFYRNRAPRAARIIERALDAANDYERAWDQVISAGAPAHVRPDDRTAFYEACAAVSSNAMRAALHEYADRLSAIPVVVLLEPWMSCFGTHFRSLSLPRLLVIRRLLPLETLGSLETARAGANAPPLIWQHSQRRLLRHCSVLPGATFVELEQAQRFSADRIDSMVNVWLSMRLGIEHALARADYHLRMGIRQMIARLLGRPPAEPPLPPLRPDLRLRMVRVVLDDFVDLPDFPAIGEAYLAVISWRVREVPHPRLSIKGVAGLHAPNLLKTPPLPPEGAMCVLLQQSCRIELIQGRWPFFNRRIAQPIGLALVHPWLEIVKPQGVLAISTPPYPPVPAQVRNQTLLSPILRSVSVFPKGAINPESLESVEADPGAHRQPDFWRPSLAELDEALHRRAARATDAASSPGGATVGRPRTAGGHGDPGRGVTNPA